MATTANTLTNVYDKILARGLLALRKMVVLPRLVNFDYSREAAQKGATIDVPLPKARTASAVTPAETPPAPEATTPGLVQVSLDQWYHADFHLSDKDRAEIDANRHFVPMEMSEAVKSLAEQVNSHVASKFSEIAGIVGSPGTNPFANTSNAKVIGTVRKRMADHQVPMQDRRMVIDPSTEADAIVMDWFRAADQSGTDETIREASLGRRFGFDWFMDQQVGDQVTHTTGTGTAYVVDNTGGYAKGSTSITLKTGSGTILVGDVVEFAGHTHQYNVTTGIAAPGTIVIAPALKEAIADDEVLSVYQAGSVVLKQNVAFHRDCIAFATRPLQQSAVEGDLGTVIKSLQDPVSGLVMRLEVSRQYKQTMWDFDILWGAKVVRPELGVRFVY